MYTEALKSLNWIIHNASHKSASFRWNGIDYTASVKLKTMINLEGFKLRVSHGGGIKSFELEVIHYEDHLLYQLNDHGPLRAEITNTKEETLNELLNNILGMTLGPPLKVICMNGFPNADQIQSLERVITSQGIIYGCSIPSLLEKELISVESIINDCLANRLICEDNGIWYCSYYDYSQPLTLQSHGFVIKVGVLMEGEEYLRALPSFIITAGDR